jgi:hypothetical protein
MRQNPTLGLAINLANLSVIGNQDYEVPLSRLAFSIAGQPIYTSCNALYVNRDSVAGCAHDNNVYSLLISKRKVRLKT